MSSISKPTYIPSPWYKVHYEGIWKWIPNIKLFMGISVVDGEQGEWHDTTKPIELPHFNPFEDIKDTQWISDDLQILILPVIILAGLVLLGLIF